ncbi:MAG: cytidylate kinase-like family protein [Spirochaetes bacterium]|nr:cytidylate kinase-like family protein [Spirochaetota bacterium]
MKEIFSIDKAAEYQESHWKERKKTVDMSEKHALPFVTLSREYGCRGYTVAEAVAKMFNEEYYLRPLWAIYDRRLLDRLMEDMHLSYELAETLTDRAKNSMADYLRMIFTRYPPEAVVYKKLVETIRIIAANGHAVIVGRVGNVITAGMPKGYHVRLIASTERKIGNIQKQSGVSRNEAKEMLEKKGEAREQFVLRHLKVNMADPAGYDLIINTTGLATGETARLIAKGMEAAGIIKRRP